MLSPAFSTTWQYLLVCRVWRAQKLFSCSDPRLHESAVQPGLEGRHWPYLHRDPQHLLARLDGAGAPFRADQAELLWWCRACGAAGGARRQHSTWRQARACMPGGQPRHGWALNHIGRGFGAIAAILPGILLRRVKAVRRTCSAGCAGSQRQQLLGSQARKPSPLISRQYRKLVLLSTRQVPGASRW
jgi:hypothetical protein